MVNLLIFVHEKMSAPAKKRMYYDAGFKLVLLFTIFI